MQREQAWEQSQQRRPQPICRFSSSFCGGKMLIFLLQTQLLHHSPGIQQTPHAGDHEGPEGSINLGLPSVELLGLLEKILHHHCVAPRLHPNLRRTQKNTSLTACACRNTQYTCVCLSAYTQHGKRQGHPLQCPGVSSSKAMQHRHGPSHLGRTKQQTWKDENRGVNEISAGEQGRDQAIIHQ